MKVRELIERLRGFDPEMRVRPCLDVAHEFEILSISAVTEQEAKRWGIKAAGQKVGVWIDLEPRDEG